MQSYLAEFSAPPPPPQRLHHKETRSSPPPSTTTTWRAHSGVRTPARPTDSVSPRQSAREYSPRIPRPPSPFPNSSSTPPPGTPALSTPPHNKEKECAAVQPSHNRKPPPLPLHSAHTSAPRCRDPQVSACSCTCKSTAMSRECSPAKPAAPSLPPPPGIAR